MWQIKNRMACPEKPIDNAVATAARPSCKANMLADVWHLKLTICHLLSVYLMPKRLTLTSHIIPINHIPPVHRMLAI